MRVLQIGKYDPQVPGGMERFLGDLLQALTCRGIETAALVHRADRSIRGIRPVAGVTPTLYRAPTFGRLLYAPLSPTISLWLHRAIREFRPQVLHLHLPNVSAFSVLLSPRARTLPWVLHWHADVVTSQIDRRLAYAYRLYRPLERALLTKARAIIATSPDYLAASPALQPWRNKCVSIPLGLDPQRFPGSRPEDRRWAESWWSGSGLRVLAVGRLTYYKGHEILIEAAARLPGIQVVIAGGGERRDRLAAHRDRFGLRGRVQLCDTPSDRQLGALFESCDLLCLPSLERTEAFGLVLLEAMIASKPVVASRIPGSGVTWVLNQARHGLLVPPGDPSALAAALAELRDHPERRASLGARGARALNRYFSMGVVAERCADLYEAVCPREIAGA